MPKQTIVHTPVLLAETLRFLNPQSGESYLDLTAGMGGHTAAILELTQVPQKAVLVDKDPAAVAILRRKFKDIEILQSDFLSASEKLAEQGRTFDLVLADLGVSSLHLNEGQRGFSFVRPGPLDMRMDPAQSFSAEQIVNSWDEQKIADLLKTYGQEPKARAIAAKIVANRPIHTTDQLAPGGRLCVISFHSLEDRLVKQAFKEAAEQGYEAQIQLLTKKPVTAQSDEIVLNPRARSAKLRAVVKIKNRKG